MSMTATMLYPAAPPPTKNTLDKEQRSRLLRSSRKLGALLGTTPLVVDPDTEAETPSSQNVAKRGNVKRHLNGLFSQSASSSSSSLSVASSATAVSTNSDYVFVRPIDARSRSRPTAAYQVQAVFDNASPSSSRSASPFPGAASRTPVTAATTSSSRAADHSATGVSRKRKQRAAGDSAGLAAPLNLIFPLPGASSGSKPTLSGASTGPNIASKVDKGKGTGTGATATAHSSQPLLLRLRSFPTRTNTTGDINNRTSQLDDHSHSPSKPLSPATSTFNMNMSMDVLLPPSPSTMSVNVHTHGLSDRARRRKMAKLARTLGENIPPELVFGALTSQNENNDNLPSTSTQPVSLTRRASASAATTLRRKNLQDREQTLESFAPFHYNFNKPTPQFNATASLPPLAVAAAPQPAPTRNSADDQARPQYHNHRQPEWERHEPQPSTSQLRPAAQVEKLSKRRLNRPRSLTLGTASAFAAATALLSRKAEPEKPEPVSDSVPAPVPVPIIIAPSPSPKRSMPQETDDVIPSRGTTSLDLESLPSSPRPRPTQTHARAQTYYDGGGMGFNIDSNPLPSPRPFVHVVDATPFDLARSSIDSSSRPTAAEMAGTLTVDWGRRKEREWSGEWNLKDMEDVAKKLRGLKGR